MLKVLIADDENIERRYLLSLFKKHPDLFEVIGEARNGKEVLQKVLEYTPDVIIMDINMPFLDGLSSAHKIKERFPNTIILLNTAYAEFEFAKKAIDYGLDAYLLKPAKESQILDAIQNCLDKRERRNTPPSTFAQTLAHTPPERISDPVRLIVEYIDKNSHCDITLQELAAVVHFSPSYISRVFHLKQGMTIKAYITQRRLENAKYLLEHSDLSIQEIASSCGFSTTPNFNWVFKLHVGFTPLEYRHQHS